LLVQVCLQVGVTDRHGAFELRRGDLDVLDGRLLVAVGELALDLLVRNENGSLDHRGVLLEDEALPHFLLEALGRVAVGAQEPLVLGVAHEMAVLLELGESQDSGRDFRVGDPQVQPLRRLQPQDPVDHRIEHLAGHVEGADQLRGELALVLRLLPVELRAVTAVEFRRADRVASDLRHHLARGVAAGTGVRAGEIDKTEYEDDDDAEQRPLQVVEAVAHGLEHRKEPPG